MEEQLGTIENLSQEYKQGIDMFKEHVSPEKQQSSDPSYFDKNLNQEIFTSKRGGTRRNGTREIR